MNLAGMMAGFGDDAGDATEELSWRDPKFSDWELRLNGKTYSTHKAILGQGPRHSAFLALQFTTGVGNSNATEMDKLLPDICWRVFETVLDFFYTGKLEPTADTVVLIFKTAH
eukprot:360487-Prymnesium_polylepis.1